MRVSGEALLRLENVHTNTAPIALSFPYVRPFHRLITLLIMHFIRVRRRARGDCEPLCVPINDRNAVDFYGGTGRRQWRQQQTPWRRLSPEVGSLMSSPQGTVAVGLSSNTAKVERGRTRCVVADEGRRKGGGEVSVCILAANLLVECWKSHLWTMVWHFGGRRVRCGEEAATTFT